MPAVEYIQANRLEQLDEALGDLDAFIGSNLRLTNLTGHPEISIPGGFFDATPTSLSFTGKLTVSTRSAAKTLKSPGARFPDE